MKALLGSRALIISALLLLAGTIVPFMIWGEALEAAFSVQGARISNLIKDIPTRPSVHHRRCV